MANRDWTTTLLLCCLAAAPLGAQADPQQAAWDSVGKVLQTAPAPQAGYLRFNFPRRDIALKVRDVTV